MLAAKDQFFDRFGGPLAACAVFFLPLKLAPAYIFLVPFILLWLYAGPDRLKRISHPLFTPLLVFIFVALISAPFGIAPSRSLPKFFNLFLFALAIPAYTAVIEKRSWHFLVAPLLAGQTIAALHSVAEGSWPQTISPWFLGKVTESGQLSLVLPLLGALALTSFAANEKAQFIRASLLGAVIFLSLAIPGLHMSSLDASIYICAFAGFAAIAVALARKPSGSGRVDGQDACHKALLVSLFIPILAAAFVINLKRGPWVGVFLAGAVYLMLSHRRLILPAILATLIACFFIEPIQTRLASSSEHFFIQGGRNMMWHIGAELASRYPLGIGYHNSAFLRNFALEIPPTHTHFHNNFLNILVETGWLGLCCFLWWLSRIFKAAFFCRSSHNPALAIACGCAILAWQIAGIVEYNFGDAEVAHISYLIIALLVSITPPAANTSIARAPEFDIAPTAEPSYTAPV